MGPAKAGLIYSKGRRQGRARFIKPVFAQTSNAQRKNALTLHPSTENSS
jgi:hypothetical protein